MARMLRNKVAGCQNRIACCVLRRCRPSFLCTSYFFFLPRFLSLCYSRSHSAPFLYHFREEKEGRAARAQEGVSEFASAQDRRTLFPKFVPLRHLSTSTSCPSLVSRPAFHHRRIIISSIFRNFGKSPPYLISHLPSCARSSASPRQ